MILALGAILFSMNVSADLKPMAVSDIGVMMNNDNGTYTVVCLNGNRETVTDLDLSLGNVCPNRTTSEPSEILSMQFREDGSFDVVCRNMTKVVATAEQIMAGGVCAPPAPVFELEDGAYTVQSGNSDYCDQRIEARHQDNQLVGLKVYFTSPCSASREMTCEEGACTSSDYEIQVLSATTYQFSRQGGQDPAVFGKK